MPSWNGSASPCRRATGPPRGGRSTSRPSPTDGRVARPSGVVCASPGGVADDLPLAAGEIGERALVVDQLLAEHGVADAEDACGEDAGVLGVADGHRRHRSEEHTSELQSLMRISYAVFC